MKIMNVILAFYLAGCLITSVTWAGPNKRAGGPPGLAKKGKVPPGLAKKGGLPPGIAKKYAVGANLPRGTFHPVEPRYRSRLPYDAPQGRRWVRIGDDLYLVGDTTSRVVDVIQNWLR